MESKHASPFVGKNHFRRYKFSINTCISFKYRTNWVKQSGIKFQESACIILGADCDELTFGQITDVYIVSNGVYGIHIHFILHVLYKLLDKSVKETSSFGCTSLKVTNHTTF